MTATYQQRKENYLKSNSERPEQLFREAKRHEDWEFCWQLYADWARPLAELPRGGIRVRQWARQNWIGGNENIGGSWIEILWDVLYRAFTSHHLTNRADFGHAVMSFKNSAFTAAVLVGFFVALPNGHVYPGRNFPDLIPIPENLFQA